MTTKIILVLLMAAVAGGLTVAQELGGQAVEGTLMLSKKNYELKHALAYETTIDNEEAVAVVLSTQAVANEQLLAARKAEQEGDDPDFKKPFLRLVFEKTGEIKHWSAASGGTSIGRSSGTATGELKLLDGRVTGKAAVANDPQGMIPSSFEVRFDTRLVKAGESLPESTAKKGGPAAKVPASVTGSFKGNGKEAKLAHVSARWSEPFAGKPGIELVFTEKDQAKEKNPHMPALFGRLGNALIISLHEDGQIYGCHVLHSAHQKQGFSSIGSLEATEFTYADGKVEGEFTTHGEKDTFGEKWEVNIKFVAPLGEIPKEFQVEEKRKETTTSAVEPDEDDEDDNSDDEPAAKTTAAGPSAKDVALTKDATDVEYKSLVGQIDFKSKSDVKKVCAELAANLKAQGWTVDGPDMINPQSSILRRKHGKASLTIFVKPADGGSEVKVMSDGLSW